MGTAVLFCTNKSSGLSLAGVRRTLSTVVMEILMYWFLGKCDSVLNSKNGVNERMKEYGELKFTVVCSIFGFRRAEREEVQCTVEESRPVT